MTDYTFLIGKYNEAGLQKELAAVLAATQRAAAPENEKKKRMAVVLPVVMALVGVYLIVAGIRQMSTLFLVIGALSLLGGGYYTWSGRSVRAQLPLAKRLLASLNAIEASSKAAVQFSEDRMTIRAKNNAAEVSYDEISVAAESERLYALVHQKAVTVLQKKDLVGKTPQEVSAYLQQKLAERFLGTI